MGFTERPKRAKVDKEYIRVLRPCLHFHGIQIKSEDCFRKFAAAVDEIEGLVGIHSSRVRMEEIFVCPDIDLDKIPDQSPMEILLIGLIKQLKCKGRDI